MKKDIDGNRLLKEIYSLLLLFLGIFLLISLYSYNPTDPSFNVETSSLSHIHNMGGIIGAYLAGTLVETLGLLSWVIPLMSIWGALMITFPSLRPRWYRSIGIFLLFICILLIASSPLGGGIAIGKIKSGGVLGEALYQFLYRYLRRGGIILLWTLLFIIGIQLIFCLLWEDMFSLFKTPFSDKKKVGKEKSPLHRKENKKTPVTPPVKENTQRQKDIRIPAEKKYNPKIKPLEYEHPPISLLDIPEMEKNREESPSVYDEISQRLIECLKDFGIEGDLLNVQPGPVVTMFEFRPAPGIKISKIANLNNDLALALKAVAIRIEAPIPGKDYIGIEVPNRIRRTVYFREIVESGEFASFKKGLPIALGKDIAGTPRIYDLSRMPHLLVAGATGAGKSVCLNSIIISLLMKFSPANLRFLLIDPKRIELASYSKLPHLLHPVVTEMELAKTALEWAVSEMENRYNLMAEMGVRNISSFNEKCLLLAKREKHEGDTEEDKKKFEPLPYLVVIIDEMADLMLTVGKEAEAHIIRLAQLARAAGIHLILATQRPSVDVVTGLIKANFPARIAFQVTSKHDSRTILDTVGAENLLGKGDMLFKPPAGRIQRIHGSYISDGEIERVIEFWREKYPSGEKVDLERWKDEEGKNPRENHGEEIYDDPLYREAVEFVMEQGRASISMIQRYLRIGFNRAARYVEQMEKDGIIGPQEGSKPRMVLKRK